MKLLKANFYLFNILQIRKWTQPRIYEALAETTKVPITVDIGVHLDWSVTMAVDSGLLADFKLLLFFLNAVG